MRCTNAVPPPFPQKNNIFIIKREREREKKKDD
jgi:hypothetical protein